MQWKTIVGVAGLLIVTGTDVGTEEFIEANPDMEKPRNEWH